MNIAGEEIKVFFIKFMEGKGYTNHGGKLSKGYVIVNFMASGKMLRAIDKNPNHRHEHIVSCKTPSTTEDAETWYRLLEIEKKEIGTKAWKILQGREGEKNRK